MLRPVSDAAIDSMLLALTREAGAASHKTRHLVVGHDLLDRVGAWLTDNRASKRDILICDSHTHKAAASRLADRLRTQGRVPETLVLEPQPGEEHVVCDDGIIEGLRARLAKDPEANAIAVGAGTINDTVKMATTQLERPFLCLPTAASMNGYTSTIAAVLSRGVKRTLPAQQAEAVFADIDIVQQAPAYLNQAGFGDLLSKPYSHADWLLSHWVRGVPYEERPARLLDDAYEALLRQASSIGAAEASGIATLTRTILLSGFTMAIAGTSSPASGGEHLVSHYWDMEQHCRALPLFGLHGAQVGVATRLSALLFERLVALEQEDIDVDAAVEHRGTTPSPQQLSACHPRMTAAVAEEIREQLAAKQKYGAALRDELSSVRERWSTIRASIASVLKPSQKMTQALASAGAADRPSALGIERDHAVATLRVCRHIRGRYVALDLMDDLGFLHGWAADAVDQVEA